MEKEIPVIRSISPEWVIFDDITISKMVIDSEIYPGNDTFFGCDPGTVNLGLCIIHSGYTELFQAKIIRSKDPILRMKLNQYILPRITEYTNPTFSASVIEYASFSDKFRQVELAEQRITFADWLERRSKIIRLVTPMSIRFHAFGSAKFHATDVYQDIPKDAAVALSCAKVAKLIHEGRSVK